MAVSSVRYREHRPIPALRSHVRVLWELSGACDDPAPQRMIPDGAMSLWLSFGAALTHVDGGVARGGTLFLGEVRRPFEIGSDGALEVIGVSFWPGRARAFVDAPLRELVDRSIADPPLSVRSRRRSPARCMARSPRTASRCCKRRSRTRSSSRALRARRCGAPSR